MTVNADFVFAVRRAETKVGFSRAVIKSSESPESFTVSLSLTGADDSYLTFDSPGYE